MSEYIVCPHCHNPLSQNEYVKVIRCRDCKYLDATRGTLVPRAGICTATCIRLSAQIPLQNIDSGFCAWGKQVEQ